MIPLSCRYIAFAHQRYYALGGFRDLAGMSDDFYEARDLCLALVNRLGDEEGASLGHVVDMTTDEICFAVERNFGDDEPDFVDPTELSTNADWINAPAAKGGAK